jgi:hypothetical protein
VDARFEYEFSGGCIRGSRNVRSVAAMKALFDEFRQSNLPVVFHCEFSKNRGPALMHRFREHDRRENLKHYPALDFPGVFLLEGGYARFYEECRDDCEGGYVSMRDPRFVQSGKLRRSHTLYVSSGLAGTSTRPERCASFAVPHSVPAGAFWGAHVRRAGTPDATALGRSSQDDCL